MFRAAKSLLLIGLILVVLVGCSSNNKAGTPGTNNDQSAGNSQDSQNKTVVNYWYWLDDATNDTIEQLIQQFNSENPDIEVVGRLIPFNDFQLTLINSVATGDAPDASKFKDWWTGQFAERNLLAPLDEYIKQWEHASDIDDIYYDMGRTASPSSPVYMMPHQFITFYMYYRADLFEEANLTPPKTLDEFLDAAKKLTDPSKQKYGFAYRGGGGGQDQWYAFMVAAGARMVDENGNIIINNEAGVQANQWYADLHALHKVTPPSSVSDSYAQLMAGFQAGTTAMLAHHVGSYENLSEVLGDKLGVIPMPQADPDNPATMGSMTGNIMFETSKSKEATWKFLSWLSSAEATDVLSQSTNGQLPVLNSLISKPEYQKNEAWKVSLESLPYSHVWPPFEGVGAVAGNVWKDNNDLLLFNKASSQEMLDKIAEALTGN